MKKALLIGINSYPTAPLMGCINDVNNINYLMRLKYGIDIQDIIVLKDSQATTENVNHELVSFVAQMQPGHAYLLQYSGHGSQMPERIEGEEIDKLDECICPIDFDFSPNHAIVDNDFNEIFSKIPTGAVLYWLSDSCHSGDLERSFEKTNRLFPMTQQHFAKVERSKRKEKSFNLPNVVLISGCRSDQTSADDRFGDSFQGAFTKYFLDAINDNIDMPLSLLVDCIKRKLHKNGFKQVPQLEAPDKLRSKPFFKPF